MLVFETKPAANVVQVYREYVYSLSFGVECISSNICETCDTCIRNTVCKGISHIFGIYFT